MKIFEYCFLSVCLFSYRENYPLFERNEKQLRYMDPEINNYQGIGSILRIDLITSHSVEGIEESKIETCIISHSSPIDYAYLTIHDK